MVCVVATIEVVEGKRDEYLREIWKVVPKVRKEKGCIEYLPVIDFPAGFSAQDPVREDRVTILERWENIEALKAHMETPHMKEYREGAKKFIVAAKIQIFTPA